MSTFAEKLHLRLDYGEHVNINYDKVKEVSHLLKKVVSDRKPFDWRDSKYWPEDSYKEKDISQFFTLGNSINFKYWRLEDDNEFIYLNNDKGSSIERGAHYMWRSLKLCLDEGKYNILDSKYLSKISFHDFKNIFQNDKCDDVMPELEERHKNWKDLGLKLTEFWGGEFYNIIKSCNRSIYNFIQYSRQFRAYDDPLCKMIMVNALIHKGRGLIKFDEPLFPGMDYQLLKEEIRIGMLLLDDEISQKIINKTLLTQQEARELRNAGLMAFFNIMNDTGIDGDVVDNIFWLNKDTCKNSNPLCSNCIFREVCQQKIQFNIPLEKTRYY